MESLEKKCIYQKGNWINCKMTAVKILAWILDPFFNNNLLYDSKEIYKGDVSPYPREPGL